MNQAQVSAQEAEDAMQASVACGSDGPGRKPTVTKSLSVEKQRHNTKIVAIIESIDKKNAELEVISNKQQASATKLAQNGDSETKENGEKMVAEGKEKWLACAAHIDGIRATVVAKQSEIMNGSNTVDKVGVAFSEVVEAVKTLNKDSTKTFRDFVVGFNKLDREKKTGDLRRGAGVRAAAQNAERPKPPLWTILMLSERGDHNMSESIFEVKAGVRAAASPVIANFDAIVGNPKVKGAINNNKKGVKLGQQLVKTAVAMSLPTWNKFKALLIRSSSPELFSMMTFPRANWTSEVTSFNIVSSDAACVQVGVGNFGFMENRLILSGDMVIHGFKVGSVPGNTLAEKRQFLIQAPPPLSWSGCSMSAASGSSSLMA